MFPHCNNYCVVYDCAGSAKGCSAVFEGGAGRHDVVEQNAPQSVDRSQTAKAPQRGKPRCAIAAALRIAGNL